MKDQLYTVKEFMYHHKLSRSSFYRHLANGTGPDTIKLGKRRYIPVKSAEKWLDKLIKTTNEK